MSGGDPTLRNREELIEIVKRITEKGMRASLFTNGILATRDLLDELCKVGLVDVAFHIDMTQQRKGYQSETELNQIREKYIDRVRGLPLAVFFNTTVYEGNFHEIPALVQFFRQHTDVVSLISFQLQADTGRGVLREREATISPDTVAKAIQQGAEKALNFDTLLVGHPSCNRYAMAFSINGNLYDFYNDPEFIVPLLNATKTVNFSRTNRKAGIRSGAWAFFKCPKLWLKGLKWLIRTFWSAKADLWAARGKIEKLTFFIHNFMDACHLEHDRLNACIFMVATQDGPLSMCLHNAKRDDYILRPLTIEDTDGKRLWQPLAGKTTVATNRDIQHIDPKIYPIKFLKGRVREHALKEKKKSGLSSSAQEIDATISLALEE